MRVKKAAPVSSWCVGAGCECPDCYPKVAAQEALLLKYRAALLVKGDAALPKGG